ncbi:MULTISPECIES: UDP-N-acetylglucosamine 2-epimerase (non-hydrolyzing) [unclassified Mesorhizobium]|uniref:non-hydrolyzing UDP-N-acetylglucosamine 2-epimerase n=1 Tax=unclassified Mesorhizobium TaxID=325217 RepID=UPI003336E96A
MNRYDQKKILCVIGTRPEAIKMAPVIIELQEASWANPIILVTGQHRELLHSVLADLALTPDIDFDIMKSGQDLVEVVGTLTMRLGKIIDELTPDIIVAQGDTASVLAASLSSFLKKIPFAHVEAGLRSGDLTSPYPEEFNRRVATLATTLHFAPTEGARQKLLQEGIEPEAIHVTGNTVIDAVRIASSSSSLPVHALPEDRVIVLLTLHRRENFGDRARQIFAAVDRFARQRSDIHFVYPVHPNPNINELAHSLLGKNPAVTLLPAQGYLAMIALIKRAKVILTDSGGVQEEAPFLGKPVLVLRTETERPEAMEQGLAKLVGYDQHRLEEELARLLDDEAAYQRMARKSHVFGNGFAAQKVSQSIKSFLNM